MIGGLLGHQQGAIFETIAQDNTATKDHQQTPRQAESENR
jgi:hypothetical protein